MKHIYAVSDRKQLDNLQAFVLSIEPRFSDYLAYLKEAFQVSDIPRCILWTDLETATQLISDIPLPAYTNDYRTVFCPDLSVWREIYLRQLDHAEIPAVRNYYTNQLTRNHVLQILGHEFVHHSELFLDGFDSNYESGIWFEEGMCEYISRKFFLTEEEFQEEAKINALLAEQFRSKYGNHSLEDFGRETYQNDNASIFFEYWRSFLAVQQIIRNHNGDVSAVFRSYHRWHSEKSSLTLEQWFGL